MANEKNYPKGFRLFKPHEKAPTFVKASVVLTANEFVAWMRENEQHMTDYNGQKQFKFQLLENDKGLYMVLDTYKKENNKGLSNDNIF